MKSVLYPDLLILPVLLNGSNGAMPMLVLSRYKNESIMIGDDIEIMIISVKGNKVRLGIKAPRNIAVNRKEIYLKIQEDKEWGIFDPNK